MQLCKQGSAIADTNMQLRKQCSAIADTNMQLRKQGSAIAETKRQLIDKIAVNISRLVVMLHCLHLLFCICARVIVVVCSCALTDFPNPLNFRTSTLLGSAPEQ